MYLFKCCCKTRDTTMDEQVCVTSECLRLQNMSFYIRITALHTATFTTRHTTQYFNIHAFQVLESRSC